MGNARAERRTFRIVRDLIAVGFIAGSVLAGLLKIAQFWFGNEAYPLLFNMDYIPLLKQWNDVRSAGFAFHYVTCIASVIFLFFCLKRVGWQDKVWPYMAVFGAGGGILYFLSALTDAQPKPGDFYAWMCWTIGHLLFGYVSGELIQLLHRSRGLKRKH